MNNPWHPFVLSIEESKLMGYEVSYGKIHISHVLLTYLCWKSINNMQMTFFDHIEGQKTSTKMRKIFLKSFCSCPEFQKETWAARWCETLLMTIQVLLACRPECWSSNEWNPLSMKHELCNKLCNVLIILSTNEFHLTCRQIYAVGCRKCVMMKMWDSHKSRRGSRERWKGLVT